MKTPEQIAEAILAEHKHLRSVEVESMVREAAREAQRDAEERGYMRAVNQSIDAGFTRAPQFAPEGEPDEFRVGWNDIEGWSSYVVRITGISRYGDGEQSVAFQRVKHDQAKHILAYLSEESRRG